MKKRLAVVFVTIWVAVFGVLGVGAAVPDGDVGVVERPVAGVSGGLQPSGGGEVGGGGLGVGEVVAGVEDTIHAYRTGGWLGVLAVLVALLTGWLRKPVCGRLLDRLPKRVRILVPLFLGCISALLGAHAAGGVPWGEAVVLAVLTGPTAVALHQGVARSLLGGQSPETRARTAPLRAGGGKA
jgi:hypothetical protein